MRSLFALALCLLSTSMSAGETSRTLDRSPTPAPNAEIEQHLLETMMRFRLAAAEKTREPARRALETMLRRTSPPLDEGERAREFLHAYLRRIAVDGGSSASTTHDLHTDARKIAEPLPLAEALRRTSIDAVFRSIARGPSGCCSCVTTAGCSDFSYCNGVEQCVSGFCVSGTAPCADDGDRCTTDTCSESLDQCFYDPLPPPTEVDLLLLDEDVTPGSTRLSWDPVAGAGSYNLYAGGLTNLSDLACILPGLTTTSVVDTSIPAPLLLYLVSSEDCGESGLGDATSGPRVPSDTCP